MVWTLTEKFGIQFVKVFLGIVLARLLTPADYGLIGMITIFFVISQVFIDSGFGLAYIQKKEATQADSSTIFYFNLLVSVVLYALLFVCSPLIARFYDQPQLVSLTRISGLVLLVNAFGVIQNAELTKQVDFKKRTFINISSSLFSGGTAIFFAYRGLGVWSLVLQSLMSSFLKTAGLWLFYSWRPVLVFRFESLKSMFSFSLWALLSALFNTFFQNFYALVIGKLFPVAQLGFYTKARQFQSLITRQLSSAVGVVSFPVFSHLQDDKEKLASAVKSFNIHVMFLVLMISSVVYVVSEPLFLLLLTEKWSTMIPYFQLLLAAGVFYPMHMVNVQVLSAQGHANLSFRLELIKNAIRVANIVICYRWGVYYIVAGEVLLSVASLAINTYYSKKLLNYGFFYQLKDVGLFFISAIISVGAGLFVLSLVSSHYLQVVIGVFLSFFIYNSLIFVFNRQVLLDTIKMVRSRRNG